MNSVENYGLRYLEPKDLDQYNALLRYTFKVCLLYTSDAADD